MSHLKENADLPDFTPGHAYLLLQGVYGDFPHKNNGLHLYGGVTENTIWQRCWRRIATQLASWYTKPYGAVGRRFTAILAAEWRGVIGRTRNPKRPLVFAHVVLTKTLGVHGDREIRARITRRMDLWERCIHTGLVGDAEAKGAAREGRADSGGEAENKAVARSYHDTVFLVKLRQAVRQATDGEGGDCLLLDKKFNKTGKPVCRGTPGEAPGHASPPRGKSHMRSLQGV